MNKTHPYLKKFKHHHGKKLSWLYVLCFFVVFIIIAYQNIALQQQPNFNYQRLATGQWKIIDDIHPTMRKGTVIDSIIIDHHSYPLNHTWIKKSFYPTLSFQNQQKVIYSEHLLYQASSVVLVDTQDQVHEVSLQAFTLSDISVYTLILYVLGWLMFITGFITGNIGQFNSNKQIFLLATTITGLTCFGSVSTIDRVWAIDPDILYFRYSIASLGVRFFFFLLTVLWLRVPNDLLRHSKILQALSASLFIILISTWVVYYLHYFLDTIPNFSLQMTLPIVLVLITLYLSIYLQWRTTSKASLRKKSDLKLSTVQHNYKISQDIALRWVILLLVISGIANIFFNFLIKFNIIIVEDSFALSCMHFLLLYIGSSLLILHQYLYKIELWWWHIWGICLGCSFAGASFILLNISSLRFSIFSILFSSIMGLLGYMVTIYYVQVKYAKTEAKILTIAMPKLMSINSKDIPITTINNIWKEILISVFHPKYIECLSYQTVLADLANSHKNKLNRYPSNSKGFSMIINAGETMLIQAIDDKMFVLHYANNGLKLFQSKNLKTAKLLWNMVKQAHDVTLAYQDGEKTERKRIAHDLHDDIGGKLLHLSSQGGDYGTYASKTLQDLRTLTHALSKESQTLSLIIADIRYQLSRCCDNTDIELIFLSDIDTPISNRFLSTQASVNLICILNELTRNAVQNPSTTTLSVNIFIDQQQCQLSIENDGEVTDPSKWHSGLGTASVERRVNQLLGEIHWNAKKEGGVICQVTWKTTRMYKQEYMNENVSIVGI